MTLCLIYSIILTNSPICFVSSLTYIPHDPPISPTEGAIVDISITETGRVVTSTDASRMVELNLSILTKRWSWDVEAFAPLPGLGHEDRIRVAVKAYNQSNASYLILGGANSEEKTYENLNVHTLRAPAYGLKRADGVITKAVNRDTLDLIDWVMEQVRNNNVRSLAIFTSPYHLLRSFGTAIRALDRHHMDPIPIIPISVGSLDDIVPESLRTGTVKSGHDMVAGEVLRFQKYSQQGDVADYEQILSYMTWMRSEHPAMQLAA